MFKRFRITWLEGRFFVSTPNYQGGEVVDAEAFDAAVKALEEIEDLGENGVTAARLGNIAHAALISIRSVVGGSRND